MQDLQIELKKYRDKLDTAIKTLQERGQAKAQAEHDYRVALAKEILMQRSDGVPVTVISDICRGKEEIAKLKLERDVAETLYESCMQAIYSTKINIDLVQKQIEAERKGI
jgi:capsule polysaccharide export protein KpsE/RkpR